MKDFAEFSNEERIIFNGNSYNHPVSITVNPIEIEGKTKSVIIHKEGKYNEAVSVVDPNIMDIGRGVRIKIRFLSEDGYYWTMKMYFHKGETFILTQKHNDLNDWQKENPDQVIWRD